MQSVDESLSKLAGSKLFWKITLTEHSKTTHLIHHTMRKIYLQQASLWPVFFQRTLSQILAGLPETVCHTDDISVHPPERKTEQFEKNNGRRER